MTHVAIVGSRGWSDLERVRACVAWARDEFGADTVIVSGGAKGVDAAAERAARELGLHVLSYRPVAELDASGYVIHEYCSDESRQGPYRVHGHSYPSFGKAAFARNGDIVRAADRLIAFWDGRSRGTEHTIRLAQQMGKRVQVVLPR